jgi:acyl-CoA oxidase
VRRQGYASSDDSESGNVELQILDYQQQQHRLFPLPAASYCFLFTGKRVLQQLKDLEQTLVSNIMTSNNNNNNTDSATTTSTMVSKTLVSDIHASTSALKSFVTMITADGMEDCRKACGGHGFLACSGLPELAATKQRKKKMTRGRSCSVNLRYYEWKSHSC